MFHPQTQFADVGVALEGWGIDADAVDLGFRVTVEDVFHRNAGIPVEVVVEFRIESHATLQCMGGDGIHMEFAVACVMEFDFIAVHVGEQVFAIDVEVHGVGQLEDVATADMGGGVEHLSIVVCLVTGIFAVELGLGDTETDGSIYIEWIVEGVFTGKADTVVFMVAPVVETPLSEWIR